MLLASSEQSGPGKAKRWEYGVRVQLEGGIRSEGSQEESLSICLCGWKSGKERCPGGGQRVSLGSGAGECLVVPRSLSISVTVALHCGPDCVCRSGTTSGMD